MKKVRKCMMGMVMLAMLIALPAQVWATTTTTTTTTGTSKMTLTVGTTLNAAVGDIVSVRLVGSNNPGLTTFAVKLGYDDNYLTYNGGATWSDTILGSSSGSTNLQMITETQENSQPVLNISAIFSGTYTSNETMVTLYFTVKRAYTTQMPITLSSSEIREVTDANYQAVDVSVVQDPTAGLSSQNLIVDTETQTPTQTPSQDTSQGNSQGSSSGSDSSGNTGSGSTGSDNSSGNTGSGSTGSGDSANSGNTNSGSTGSGTTTDGSSVSTGSGNSSGSSSTGSSGSSTGTTKNGVDQTPKTGAINVRTALVAVIVVFIAVAGVCVRVLRKKQG
jgi:hypothetical protein